MLDTRATDASQVMETRTGSGHGHKRPRRYFHPHVRQTPDTRQPWSRHSLSWSAHLVKGECSSWNDEQREVVILEAGRCSLVCEWIHDTMMGVTRTCLLPSVASELSSIGNQELCPTKYCITPPIRRFSPFTTRLIPDCDSSSIFAAQRSTFTALLVRAGPAPRRNPFSPQSEGQVSTGHADLIALGSSQEKSTLQY